MHGVPPYEPLGRKASSSDETDRPGVAAYVVPSRLRDAIRSLSEDLTTGPARLTAGVVSDAPTLARYVGHCLSADFEVESASDLVTLEETLGRRRPGLLVADLYTLDHHTAGALTLLTTSFGHVPLLVLAQEPLAAGHLPGGAALARPSATLPLPAPSDDLRRLARALARP